MIEPSSHVFECLKLPSFAHSLDLIYFNLHKFVFIGYCQAPIDGHYATKFSPVIISRDRGQWLILGWMGEQ